MVRLPVSGAEFVLRPPIGADDILLLEAGDEPTSLGITLLQRLCSPSGSCLADIGALVLTDYQTLLLRVYQAVLGGKIETTVRCGQPACQAAIAVSFDIDSYAAHQHPRRPATVVPDDEPGWWRLADGLARYRLPTAADVAVARREAEPEAWLRRHCIDPADVAAPVRRRAERAMALQAPDLSGTVQAVCRSCGATLEVLFDVEDFVLRALRAHAAFLYEDAHLLALHYHWPEETILAMPRARRVCYADMLRGAA